MEDTPGLGPGSSMEYEFKSHHRHFNCCEIVECILFVFLFYIPKLSFLLYTVFGSYCVYASIAQFDRATDIISRSAVQTRLEAFKVGLR